MGGLDDFILPDSVQKKETMFVIPLFPIVKAIYDLQKAEANLDDMRLVVPTETDNQFGIEKFYIVHKSSVK